jgi:osmotically-inducible protein OsmY
MLVTVPSCTSELQQTHERAPGWVQPLANIGHKEELADARITREIVQRLEKDPGIHPEGIVVTTDKGVAQLNGTVPDLLSKDRAAGVAEMVRGVRAVVDQVEVRAPERSDADIEQDISGLLQSQAAIASFDVRATATNGGVTLRGNVESGVQKQLAGLLAETVPGVRNVDDQLAVITPPQPSDPTIEDDIATRLHWDALVSRDPVTVTVSGGNVSLTGMAGSTAELSRIYSDAWVDGVRTVDTSGVAIEALIYDPALWSATTPWPSDAKIAGAIVDAMVRDPRVKSYEVRPKVNDGTVTLLGIVEEPEAKLAAESIARDTIGVVDVHDRIQLRFVSPETDEARAERIRSALAIDLATRASNFTVAVVDAKATLRGTADNDYATTRAAALSAAVSGVQHVDVRATVEYPQRRYVHVQLP